MIEQAKSRKIGLIVSIILVIMWIVVAIIDSVTVSAQKKKILDLWKQKEDLQTDLQKQKEDHQARYDFAIGKFRETIKSASFILAKSGLELPEKCWVKRNFEVNDEHNMLEIIQDLLDCIDSAMEMSEDIRDNLVIKLTNTQIELLEAQMSLKLITKSYEKCETMAKGGTHVYKKATAKRWRASAFRWKNQVQGLEEQVETLKRENEALRNNRKPRVQAPVPHKTPRSLDIQENDQRGCSK